MESLVLMEAYAEVADVMKNGAQVIFTGGEWHKQVPFAELDRAGKVGMLEYCIDWNAYFDCGLAPEVAERIVENAVDGKSQDRWMEPIENLRSAFLDETIAGIRQIFMQNQPGLSFNELLKSYGDVEPSRELVQYGRGL